MPDELSKLVTAGLWLAFFAGVIWLLSRVGVRRRRPRGTWRQRRRVRLGRGFDMAELAKRLNVPEHELRTLPIEYCVAHIPKRRGGQRTLHIPSPQLKAMQRRILHRLLKKLHTHPCAMAFEPGWSIVDNANAHVGQDILIKLDIVDYFTSTRAERVDEFFRWVGWNAEAAKLLTGLTCHEGGLPQGAPISPRLSNLVNVGMDVALAMAARSRDANYTRYADDITISLRYPTPRRARGMVEHVRRILRPNGYRLNRDKTRILRPHQRMMVTGLMVNEKVQLPRETRRWLRAVRHHLASGRPATLSPAQLAGWEALEAMIQKQRNH